MMDVASGYVIASTDGWRTWAAVIDDEGMASGDVAKVNGVCCTEMAIDDELEMVSVDGCRAMGSDDGAAAMANGGDIVVKRDDEQAIANDDGAEGIVSVSAHNDHDLENERDPGCALPGLISVRRARTRLQSRASRP